MSSAQSEPEGKAPTPSLDPGSRPSASKLSDRVNCEFFLAPLTALLVGTGVVDGAGDAAAKLSSTSLGVDISSSSTLTGVPSSSFSISMFQLVSYSMTCAEALEICSRPHDSSRSASVWYMEPGGLNILALLMTRRKSDCHVRRQS